MSITSAWASLLAAFLLFFTTGVVAQEEGEAPTPATNVCEETPEFDQFDFWLGEWGVFTNNEERTRIGTNTITKHYSECLVKEEWVDANGNGGFSMNFYNPVRGHWRQVWVSNGFFIDYTGGLDENGRMVLEGESDQYVAGSTMGLRGIWSAEENGDVIQQFETLDAESGEWKKVFEARYVKQ